MNHNSEQGPDIDIVESPSEVVGDARKRLVTIKLDGSVTGTLVGFAPDTTPLIDFPSTPESFHVRARSCVALDPRNVGQEVVLLLDGGDPQRPIIVGLLRPAKDDSIEVAPVQEAPRSYAQEVELDGQTIELTAKKSITLRCGEASITLNKDGTVVIRGVHIVSHAAGVHRIRGGSVQLN